MYAVLRDVFLNKGRAVFFLGSGDDPLQIGGIVNSPETYRRIPCPGFYAHGKREVKAAQVIQRFVRYKGLRARDTVFHAYLHRLELVAGALKNIPVINRYIAIRPQFLLMLRKHYRRKIVDRYDQIVISRF